MASTIAKYSAVFGRGPAVVRPPSKSFGIESVLFPPTKAGFWKRLLSEAHDMSVYMTAGMSEHRIGPADSSPAEYAERVELMAICEVPVAGGLNGQEDVPTQVLQDIGDFILSQKIIVEVGHTLDFQSPLASNTAMTAFLFATPPDGIDAKRIRKCSKAQEILNLVPITSAELEFTRREGVMALLDKFEASGTEPVFDVFRKSAV